ncbi:uncharacterized membrane protein HdeD (DUF308 family) [Leifsonia sp. AK011]|uniref:hypothetical protein n=1 Tax=Leifsonia sp. AK011 TaxID=2723075 RepID=UPI0015C9A9AD|nr:hypothetical protein [Leifsonia sp. AK011]NYF09323.1 uncharacterized membrane protein HdeD (DUF308 family) [Leifsonia sp. AK011]
MKPWIAPLVRAVPAIVLAIVITFSADHSAALGLLTFGIFGVVSGLGLGIVALLGAAGADRTIQLIQAALTVLAGVAALTVTGGGLPYLVLIVSAWAVTTGFLEVYVGLRSRGQAGARDRMFVGALTVVLAIVVLVVPPDYTQPFAFDEVTGEVTASVIIVGLLGAYWAILGVFLAIAAIPATAPSAPAPVESSAP